MMSATETNHDLATDANTAVDTFCGAPQIDYWVSVGGMTYPAACSDDSSMEALRQAGHIVWKTVDKQRV